MAEQNNLIVYCEYEDGKVADVSLELLTKGRSLATQLGVKLQAIVAGDKLEGIEAQLFPYGVDTVYKVEDARLYPYTSLPHSSILINLFKEIKPQIAFMGATSIGRDLGPRVSSCLHSGLTADCTSLEIGSHKDPKTQKEYENLLYQIRPAFGGNIVATIVNPDCRPQMATVREGVMKPLERQVGRTGEIVRHGAKLEGVEIPVEVLEIVRKVSSVNLKGSRIIVAGGAGVGSKENFKLLHELAAVLGGAVGASRAAVDLGYVEHERQIGQTGVTVRPALFISCGISGAVQHLAGMQDSAKIIAINTDKDAPIFKVAHYGIVGDLNVVIPKMIKAIKAKGE
jgi:electron transfer flavoprotein alpha subunit